MITKHTNLIITENKFMKILKNKSIQVLMTIYTLSSSLYCTDKPDITIEPHHSQTLIQLASAHILSRAIHVAAAMKIADHLVDGPCSIHDLACKTHTNTDALYRLLRLLASNNIFHESDNQYFSLTPLAELLVSSHPDSLQAWLAHHDGDEKRWRSYGNMHYSIETGKPAFNNIFGQGYFDLIAQNPELAGSFDEGMRNLSEKEDLAIATCYNFAPYKNIMDIGGGKGGLLTAIIKSNHLIHGILYDLPHVEISAQTYLTEQNLDQFIGWQSGSFFDYIPSGNDIYILKRILHDWDDELCIKILSNCRAAMNDTSKLLIIEAIVTPGNNRDFAKNVDLAMLVLFGGKERTQIEWETLLDAAHLQLVKIQETPSMLSILEVIIK